MYRRDPCVFYCLEGVYDRQDSPAPETIISKIHVYVETITFQIHITEKHKK